MASIAEPSSPASMKNMTNSQVANANNSKELCSPYDQISPHHKEHRLLSIPLSRTSSVRDALAAELGVKRRTENPTAAAMASIKRPIAPPNSSPKHKKRVIKSTKPTKFIKSEKRSSPPPDLSGDSQDESNITRPHSLAHTSPLARMDQAIQAIRNLSNDPDFQFVKSKKPRVASSARSPRPRSAIMPPRPFDAPGFEGLDAAIMDIGDLFNHPAFYFEKPAGGVPPESRK